MQLMKEAVKNLDFKGLDLFKLITEFSVDLEVVSVTSTKWTYNIVLIWK